MQVLRYQELKRLKGIPFSRQWTGRLVREKRFPEPIALSAGTKVWVESEIDAWLADHITKRNGATEAA
jgi:predicted DNA-binding transcriptional regulator AlpA